MNKIAVVKFVARAIVGAGTTTISNSIIRNNVETTNLYQKVTVGAATVVIGSMASHAAKKHVDAAIDEMANAVKLTIGDADASVEELEETSDFEPEPSES